MCHQPPPSPIIHVQHAKYKLSYLPSHFCLSSDVRQEIYLLPWLVATWKQCSLPRTLLCRGFTSMSWEVRSIECMVTELVSRDSWDLEERIRELMMFLKGYTSTSKIMSTLSLQFSPFRSRQESGLGLLFAGTLKNRWKMAMLDSGLLLSYSQLRLTSAKINNKNTGNMGKSDSNVWTWMFTQ